MLEFAHSAFSSIAILGVLIFVHELGHFLVAKWCGVGVLDFSIGFGPRLLTWRRKETAYSLRLIPLGGFVRMMGDDPFLIEEHENQTARLEAVDQLKAEINHVENHSAENHTKDNNQDSKAPEREALGDPSLWFLNKHVFHRSLIVLAGPAFNIIFALLVAWVGVAVYGKAVPLEDAVIGAVLKDGPAGKAGLKSDDRVLSVDGVEIATFEQLSTTIRSSGGREMLFIVQRANKDGMSEILELRIAGTQEKNDFDLLDGGASAAKDGIPYRIGISGSTRNVPATLVEAFELGTLEVVAISEMTGRMLYMLVSGLVDPTKVLGGPVAVIQGAAQSASHGLETTLRFIVLLSVSLAIFNLLPIPILDGGHLMFFAIESLFGKPVGIKWQLVANQVGFAVLMLIMVFALSNDLFRIFSVQ